MSLPLYICNCFPCSLHTGGMWRLPRVTGAHWKGHTMLSATPPGWYETHPEARWCCHDLMLYLVFIIFQRRLVPMSTRGDTCKHILEATRSFSTKGRERGESGVGGVQNRGKGGRTSDPCWCTESCPFACPEPLCLGTRPSWQDTLGLSSRYSWGVSTASQQTGQHLTAGMSKTWATRQWLQMGGGRDFSPLWSDVPVGQ